MLSCQSDSDVELSFPKEADDRTKYNECLKSTSDLLMNESLKIANRDNHRKTD